MKRRMTLKEAKKFHGHLGPYLVLGILAGDLALKKLGSKKYFGLSVKVYGANKKPKSCLVDGLQLSTGATYGKGNINKFNAPAIRIEVLNNFNSKKITLSLRGNVIKQLEKTRKHIDSENLAKRLFKKEPENVFIYNLIPTI